MYIYWRQHTLLLLVLFPLFSFCIFPPAPSLDLPLERTKFKVRLLSGTPPDPLEGQEVMTLVDPSTREKNLCFLPLFDEEEEEEEKKEVQPTEELLKNITWVEKLIEPLADQCVLRMEGWWTYEYCFGSHVRQFHSLHDKIVADFFLGKSIMTKTPEEEEALKNLLRKEDMLERRAIKKVLREFKKGLRDGEEMLIALGRKQRTKNGDEDESKSVPGSEGESQHNEGQGSGSGKEKGQEEVEAEENRGEQRGSLSQSILLDADLNTYYYSVKMDHGTPCDVMNNIPRSVEVRHYCDTAPRTMIVSIREPKSCHYIVYVHSPLLCSFPLFSIEEEDKTKHIDCFIYREKEDEATDHTSDDAAGWTCGGDPSESQDDGSTCGQGAESTSPFWVDRSDFSPHSHHGGDPWSLDNQSSDSLRKSRTKERLKEARQREEEEKARISQGTPEEKESATTTTTKKKKKNTSPPTETNEDPLPTLGTNDLEKIRELLKGLTSDDVSGDPSDDTLLQALRDAVDDLANLDSTLSLGQSGTIDIELDLTKYIDEHSESGVHFNEEELESMRELRKKIIAEYNESLKDKSKKKKTRAENNK